MADMSVYYRILNGINGIWNSYGCPPQAGNGITLTLEDNSTISGALSLKNLCGFESGDKDIGVLSESSELRELVVMVPMVEEQPNKQNLYIDVTEVPIETAQEEKAICQECDEDPCGDKAYRATRHARPSVKGSNKKLYYSTIEQAYLFRIDESIINKILDVENYTTLNIYEIKQILESRINLLNVKNSIVRLMFAMTRYNFPPHLNWLLFNKRTKAGNFFIPPIVMYTAERSMALYKEDLSDIWQGNMPFPATQPQPEIEETFIEHYLNEEEMFGGYDLNEFNDIKLKIFKCKWHGGSDYEELIKGKLPKNDITKWYGYNWPYDNCSIIEYLQVQGGEIHDFTSGSALDEGVLKQQRTETVSVNGSIITKPYLSDIDPTK